MRRLTTLMTALALALFVIVPTAAGADGRGELKASFNSALSGGTAIEAHSDVAFGLASPQVVPEGRIRPWADDGREICDQLMVGTWAVFFDETKELLDGYTFEFSLDGELLDAVRTPYKRSTQDEFYPWWFSGGVPVIGVLDEGPHTVSVTFNFGLGDPDVTFTSVIDVSSDHC